MLAICEQIVRCKIRPSSYPSLPFTTPVERLYQLMLLDCAFLCEGPWSDVPQQSKGGDLMHFVECLISVPLSAQQTESNGS